MTGTNEKKLSEKKAELEKISEKRIYSIVLNMIETEKFESKLEEIKLTDSLFLPVCIQKMLISGK